MSKTGPPAWAVRLARLLVPSASREFVLGDLEELFHEDAVRSGRRRATRKYLGLALRSWLGYVLSGGPFEDLALDVRFASRSLRRQPTFTFVSAATLAIGIGATTAMLSVADAVLFRPPPIQDPARVASVWELRSGDVWESMEGRLLRYSRYEAYRERSGSFFSDVAAHSYASVAIGTEQGAVAVNGFVTSGNYFEMLGLTPLHGRLYTRDDEAVIVLSERLWRSRFGADPDVVGRVVSVDSRSFVVAGVAGAGFVGTMSTFTGDVWIPWGAFVRLTEVPEDAIRVVPLARLQPGVARSVAEARVDELARSIDAEGRTTVRGARLENILWRRDLSDVLRIGAGVLVLTAILLLVIAGANIGGMMLARSYDRRKEIAVRLAIGAGGGRLVRQLLTESCLLALIGGVVGVGLAWIGADLLSSIDFPIDATLTVAAHPDGRILLASMVLTISTGVLFGIGPAVHSAATDLSSTLKEGARGVRLGGRRNWFVATQLVIATVLLITSGVLARSFRAMTDVPLGFDPDGVTVASVALGTHGYERDDVRRFYERLVDAARALPGVESVGLARFVMLGGANESRRAVPIDGPPDVEASVWTNAVDPAYFEAMGIEAVAGRLFRADDAEGAPRVTVVNETLARRFWPESSARGSRVRLGGGEYEVVGVVPDGVYGFVYDGARPYAFVPYAQTWESSMSIHVRSSDPESVPRRLRALFRELDPAVAPSGLRSMDEVVRSNSFGARFLSGLAILFSAIGLLLAALGVHGLLAVQVAQQTKELGIRMAMGADPREVLLVVLRRGARLAAIGCGAGVVLAMATGRALEPLLYSVRPFDAPTYILVPMVLATTVLLASLAPAIRGTRVDPTVLLRDE